MVNRRCLWLTTNIRFAWCPLTRSSNVLTGCGWRTWRRSHRLPVDWVRRGFEACWRLGIGPDYFIDRYIFKRDVPLVPEFEVVFREIVNENRYRDRMRFWYASENACKRFWDAFFLFGWGFLRPYPLFCVRLRFRSVYEGTLICLSSLKRNVVLQPYAPSWLSQQ